MRAAFTVGRDTNARSFVDHNGSLHSENAVGLRREPSPRKGTAERCVSDTSRLLQTSPVARTFAAHRAVRCTWRSALASLVGVRMRSSGNLVTFVLNGLSHSKACHMVVVVPRQ